LAAGPKNKYPEHATEHPAAHGRLNVLRRDAPPTTSSRADQLDFKSHDLYAYFLIDVDMGGCFQTSRRGGVMGPGQVRCLVDLEQSKSDALDVLSKIDAEDISHEWEWRKTIGWGKPIERYSSIGELPRTELRDDKTPLAKDLENALSAQDHARAAQTPIDYLTGFSTLAQLEIAGVCYDKAHDRWFVARSHTTSVSILLRQCHVEAKRWTPWESTLRHQRTTSVPGSPWSPVLFWVDITSWTIRVSPTATRSSSESSTRWLLSCARITESGRPIRNSADR
jgi:hypothetical protein